MAKCNKWYCNKNVPKKYRYCYDHRPRVHNSGGRGLVYFVVLMTFIWWIS